MRAGHHTVMVAYSSSDASSLSAGGEPGTGSVTWMLLGGQH